MLWESPPCFRLLLGHTLPSLSERCSVQHRSYAECSPLGSAVILEFVLSCCVGTRRLVCVAGDQGWVVVSSPFAISHSVAVLSLAACSCTQFKCTSAISPWTWSPLARRSVCPGFATCPCTAHQRGGTPLLSHKWHVGGFISQRGGKNS